ncbi:MAG: stage V sporulation protein AD, partial [Lachnospiraceae bacterium]|nr:stage V sporulation protein AD [Lachnospiraceae bacterium]
MNEKQRGKASVIFQNPPLILSAASVVGKKEGEGPLGQYFDQVEVDSMLGKKNWEEAESELQTRAATLAIEKSGLKKEDIRYYFGGDLLAQLIATSFGVMNLEFPMFGIYGACSTMGEAMGLGSMVVEGGFADHVLVAASSHFASAEKQFRFPLEYGNQRPYSATWTVTGCGSVILSANDGNKRINRKKPLAKVAGVTTGKIVDMA